MTATTLKMATTFAIATIVSVTATTHVRAQSSDIEPEATRILKRMTDYLGGLQRFSVDVENMVDDVLVSGEKLQNDFSSSAVISRPNKLRARQTGYQLEQELIYDGKTVTIHNHESNYYASAAAPDNIDDMLHFARDTLDIIPPVGDILFTNAFDLLMASVTAGGVAGKAIVGGVQCDQLFFSSPLVDWQIWIADGDQPLPYKYVLTTKDDPVHPQTIVQMSNWNVAPEVNDAMFAFTPPRGAKKTEFIRMDTGPAGIR